MLKKRLWYLVIALSFVIAIGGAIKIYAAPYPCTTPWNLCQGWCQGQPSLLVYSDGTQGVLCDNSQEPCFTPNWKAYPCEGN